MYNIKITKNKANIAMRDHENVCCSFKQLQCNQYDQPVATVLKYNGSLLHRQTVFHTNAGQRNICTFII